MKTRIIVEQADNGFIVREKFLADYDEKDNPIYDWDIDVIEDKENDKETMINLLELVAGKFGYEYNKYSRENVNIKFDKKGHDVE